MSNLYNFLSSGQSFNREGNLQLFQFSLLNILLVTSLFFALIAVLSSFLGLFALSSIFCTIFIFYILTNLFQLYLLRKDKSDYTLIASTTMLISILLFYFPLLYEYDEFRLIWFFLLLFIHFILLGKKAGIILMLLLQGSIFLLNYHYPLGFSTLALYSFFYALLLFSLLLYFFIDKIEQDAKELLRLNLQLEQKSKLALKEKHEKELLLLEVHHRVKNNLAIILSMIQLQEHKYKEASSKILLNDLENRINTIAKTYEMLIVNDNLESIDMSVYIPLLLIDLEESLEYLSFEVEIICNISAILGLRESVYIGLVINELVTNAYKYAFKTKRGKLFITLLQEQNNYSLCIEDNGCGFDIQRTETSLGAMLVHSLVKEQLQGTLLLDTTKGTAYKIAFSLEETINKGIT